MDAQSERKKASLKEEYVPPAWRYWSAKQAGDAMAQGSLEATEPLVDIIAVQGLASTYERTWSKKPDNASDPVMWLRDLLPIDIPTARVLTFEYDSKWLDDPAAVCLEDCARHLLNAIIWDRSHRGETSMCKRLKKRPIVLIGHSFGGLVIKQAVVLAGNSRPADPKYWDYCNVISSLAGIIYLGTPHGGSRLAKAATFQTWFRRSVGAVTVDKLLKPLQFNQQERGELSNLENDFQELCDERNCPDLAYLRTFYFWEEKPLPIPGLKTLFVVPESSACLGGNRYNCASLNSDHKNLNKFTSREENNYVAVSKQITIMVVNAEEIVGHRRGRLEYDKKFSDTTWTNVKSWLEPFDSFVRLEKLQQDRQASTCTWALTLDTIHEWLSGSRLQSVENSQKACVWITGKPGSGKSVLSKFLYDELMGQVDLHNREYAHDQECSGKRDSLPCRPRNRENFRTALYFTFQSGQRFEVAMSTLIHQLLEKHYDDKELLEITEKHYTRGRKLSPTTSVDLLVELLETLPLTFIILDGIDELDARENETPADLAAITRLLGQLQRILQVPTVQLLVLSRPDLAIKECMKDICSPESTIEMTSHTTGDINQLILARTLYLSQINKALADSQELIRKTLNTRARGMFQWIKLLVSALEYQGISKSAIEHTLEHFPPDLGAAYQRTFDRLSAVPGHNADDAMLALKWLTCAQRPMTVREVYTAIDIHRKVALRQTQADLIVSDVVRKVSDVNEDMVEQYFATLLGPLAEIYQPKLEVDDQFRELQPVSKRIVICHYSLTQLLTQPLLQPFRFPEDQNSFQKYIFRFLPEEAHREAASVCMTTIVGPNTLESFFTHFYKSRPCQNLSPFIDYAADNWLYHLKAAGIRPSDDNDLLGSAARSIGHSLNLNLRIVGALAQVFEKVDAAKIGQMIQAVPIRDVQQMLVPTISALEKLSNCLPRLIKDLRMSNKVLAESGKLRTTTWAQSRVDAFDLQQQDPAKLCLNQNLESPAILEALLILDSMDGVPSTATDHIEVLRDAARKLRALTIKLAVDPIRTWMYGQIGDGLNPIPAFSQLTYALDTLIVVSVKPGVVDETDALRYQFSAGTDHPLYGFITSTKYELESKGRTVLVAEDYQKYILDHYLLRPIEWRVIQFITHMLETSDGDNQLLMSWQRRAAKVEYREDYNGSPGLASVEFEHSKPRSFSPEAIRIPAYLAVAPKFVFFFAIGVFINTFPHIQQLFKDVAAQVTFKGMVAKPWAIFLYKEWRYTSIAFLFYLLRRAYFPWLLASPRHHPITDLHGLFEDPTEYIPQFNQHGWTLITLIIFQEVGAVCFLAWDGMAAVMESHNQENANEPRVELNLTLRLGDFEDRNRIAHAKGIAMAIVRVVFIERTVHEAAYIIFDILRISVFLLKPSSWTSSQFSTSASTLIGRVFGRQLAAALGAATVIQLFLLLWLGPKIWGWLRLTVIVKTIFRFTLAPLVSFLWFFFLRYVWMAITYPVLFCVEVVKTAIIFCAEVMLNLVSFIGRWLFSNVISPSASAITSACGPLGLVFLISFILLVVSALLMFMMMDPLQFKGAQRSSGTARAEATRITGVDNPLEALNWRATSCKSMLGSEFVDMNALRIAGSKEKNE